MTPEAVEAVEAVEAALPKKELLWMMVLVPEAEAEAEAAKEVVVVLEVTVVEETLAFTWIIVLEAALLILEFYKVLLEQVVQVQTEVLEVLKAHVVIGADPVMKLALVVMEAMVDMVV